MTDLSVAPWLNPYPVRVRSDRVGLIYRVPAWRSPNEDGASVDIQFKRAEAAYLGPMVRKLRELMQG